MSNNKSNNKKIKFVPALLIWDEYGENIEYIIPKKLSKKFFEEKHTLVEISNDFYGSKTDEELQTVRNRWGLESKLFNERWDKYKQTYNFRTGKRKKTTLYIKE